MGDMNIMLGIALLVFLASIVSVEAALSVAIIEIIAGVIGGNFLGLESTPWLEYLSGLASIVLTFLAGVEVDMDVMKSKFKESMFMGSISFLAPFIGALLFCHYVVGWSLQASEIAGIALSTTSLAVVYAVLVETGLTTTELGKIIMASCFVTDLATVLALSILFAQFNIWTIVFVAGSIALIIIAPKIIPIIFSRYGGKVIEPEIKFILLIMVAFMYLAKLGASHAVLPVFILGFALSRTFEQHREVQHRLRTVNFAMLTPFFFIKAGMNVSLPELVANFRLLVALFAVKQVTKIGGIAPLARKFVKSDAVYTTLLMSTGLTFGTISSMFGYNAGIINKTQFSLLIGTVIASAIIPTFIAQKWFSPQVLKTFNNFRPHADKVK